MQNELQTLKQWVGEQLNTQDLVLKPIVGDASFRSYYRTSVGQQSYIVMWAPPSKEKTTDFVNIARAWGDSGIPVPKIFAWEPTQGFVLLSDFGDVLLYQFLTGQTADDYYSLAMQALLPLQQTKHPLPPFDENHTRLELQYFQDWFLQKLLGMNLLPSQQGVLDEVNALLVAQMLSQPQVPVHRDYHSRNIMVLNPSSLGIIDFQDAMQGPITYDLVSLLKDCYIRWPVKQTQHWAQMYWEMLRQENPSVAPNDVSTFLRWFDWTGLQRHLKVLGIFSRLNLRDNKPNYLKDMPRIMTYVLEVTQRYPEFTAFHDFLSNEVLHPLQSFWLQQNIEQVA